MAAGAAVQGRDSPWVVCMCESSPSQHHSRNAVHGGPVVGVFQCNNPVGPVLATDHSVLQQ